MKNYRVYTFSLFCSLVALNCFSQDTVKVAFNMNECSTCYNSIRFLSSLSPNIELTYIFPAAYQMDSADIQNSFDLPLRGKFIWSDQLNKKYLIPDERSSITYTHPGLAQPLVFFFKYETDQNLISYFNHLEDNQDTLNLPDHTFTMDTKNVVGNGSFLYLLDGLRNTVTKVDEIRPRNTDVIIKMNDQLVKGAFDTHFHNPKMWENTQSLIKQLGLRKSQVFTQMDVQKDKIYLAGKYTYFDFLNNGQDTIETSFEMIHVFDLSGKLLKNIEIPQLTKLDDPVLQKIIRGEQPGDTIVYFLTVSTLKVVEGNKFYLGVLSMPTTAYPQKPYFVAQCDYDSLTNKLSFNHFLSARLPARYENIGYNNLSNASFTSDGEYFHVMLDDLVYPTNHQPPIQLHILPDDYHPTSPFNLENVVYEINEQGNSLFFKALLGGSLKFIRLNKQTGNKEIKDIAYLQSPDHPLSKTVIMDNKDYRFLFVPINDHQLIRTKIF